MCCTATRAAMTSSWEFDVATQNQAKAADLLQMLRSSGVDTMADELEEIIAGAYDEGELEGLSPSIPRESNPYRGLGR
jgi:hypothetical protein